MITHEEVDEIRAGMMYKLDLAVRSILEKYDGEKVYDRKSAAKFLSIGYTKFLQLEKKGLIKSRKIPGFKQNRYLKSDLINLLK